MSDSPKPSAPAGIPDSAVLVEMPAGLFFEAGDYTDANTRTEDLVETRRRVSRHRSKLKAMVALQLEDLTRINSSLHAADRQGNAAPHWDSAVALLGKLKSAISHLADQIEKAERRYEESQLQTSAVGPSVVVGLSGVNYPRDMAEALAFRNIELQRLNGAKA